jgi:hypothetical protein
LEIWKFNIISETYLIELFQKQKYKYEREQFKLFCKIFKIHRYFLNSGLFYVTSPFSKNLNFKMLQNYLVKCGNPQFVLK